MTDHPHFSLSTPRGIAHKDVLVVLGQDDLRNPGEMAFKIRQYWLHPKFQ